jgi:hypothetical protein
MYKSGYGVTRVKSSLFLDASPENTQTATAAETAADLEAGADAEAQEEKDTMMHA